MMLSIILSIIIILIMLKIMIMLTGSSHPPLDKITFKHKKTDVVASPFQHPTSEEVVVNKVIALNNYTNQCLHVIGK